MKSRVLLRRIIPTSALFVLSFGLVSAAPAQPPATPLGIFEAHSDVGTTPKPGAASYDPATAEYRVIGGGANMWAGVDAFHFVWKKVNGDFDLSALVNLVGSGAEDHRKAALVVRQSLDPNSAYADVAVHGDGLTALQFRPVAGAETAEVRSAVSAPGSVLLSRRGAQLTMSAGSAGRTDPFVPSGPVTIEFTGAVYVGLGVCSHNANVLETAVFSKVVLRELPATANNLNPTKVHSDLSVYDLTTKTVSVVYSADTLWEAPNWTPDGKYLMSNSGGKLYRVDVTGKAQPERVGLDAGYEANNDHGLSPDGKRLFALTDFNGVYVINAATREVVDSIGGLGTILTGVAFHPTAPCMYVSSRDQGMVGTVNLQTDAVVRSQTVTGSNIQEVAVSRDGKLLFATDIGNSRLLVRDLTTDGSPFVAYAVGTPQSRNAFDVAVTPDNTQVYVSALAHGSTAIASTAGVVMAAGALGTILSAPRLGKLADRIGHAPVICVCLLASAVLLALQATAVNNLELGILRFVTGLCLGGLLPAITASIRHTVAPASVGQILGYSISAQYVGQVAGPEIEIHGPGGPTLGLRLQASNATVRRLAIYGFGPGAGSGVRGEAGREQLIRGGERAAADERVEPEMVLRHRRRGCAGVRVPTEVE